jgi:predicted nucleic acid-binding protein
MIPVLLDADAFRCARDLGVLDSLRRTADQRVRLYMTEYVARHELSSDAKTIEALCACNLLSIEKVSGKDVQKLLRESRDKKSGLHKGEAESIIWAKGLDRKERPLFISNDRRARRGAEQHGVPAGDLMDFLVEAVQAKVVELDEMKRLVSAVWNDREQQQCRPHDWDGFDSTFARRQARRK